MQQQHSSNSGVWEGVRINFVPGELLVGLKPEQAELSRDEIQAYLTKNGVPGKIKKIGGVPDMPTITMDLGRGADVIKAAEALINNPSVRYAEPNRTVQL